MSGIGSVLSDVLATSPVIFGILAGTAITTVISGTGWFAAQRRAAAAQAAQIAAEAAKAEMESVPERTEAARVALEAAKAAAEVAQAELESVQKRMEAAKASAKAAKDEMEAAKMMAEAAGAEMKAAKAETEAARSEIETHHQLIVDLEVKAGAQRGIIQDLLRQETDMRASYAEKKATYDRLSHEVAALENRLDFAELGIYEPTFSFGTSAEYAVALETNRANQKQMISDEKALVCPIDWTVDGSVSKGKTMTKRNIRLALRAFNNECEAILQKVSWKNYGRMRERIEKSKQAIDKLNESNRITITDAYVRLKLEEVQLVYEESLRRKQEQDALREERAQEREELRAQRELEAEIRRAEVRESQRREALEMAKAELNATTGAAHDKLVARLGELEHQLAQATAAKERALSLAQQTRVGHVYVISNIGSFGNSVFKVGMTRRLDPTDRVRELGDASVPFSFDVHAMIFTEDAPALERDLHIALEAYRVNRVNGRKEFFKVPSEKLKEIVLKQFPDVVYVDQAEAEEYYRSLPGEEIIELAQEQQIEEFPASL